MTKEDLAQIKTVVKETVETIVTPRFDKIDQKLAEHDVMLEAIIFVSDKHTKQIETLQKDMTIVKKDVNILKEDISILKKDVAVLKEDVDELKTDVKIIKTDVQALKFGQQSGELRFIKLEKKVFAV
jgi:hypothetical protein